MARHGRGFPLGTQVIFTPLRQSARVQGNATFNLLASGLIRITGGDMPQFARPSADIVNEGWVEDDGTATTIYDQIDEVVPDDADYIHSPTTPTADVYVTKLSAVTDPQVSTGHKVRYRYGKNNSGGARIDILIELRQGYVNEGSQGTLIATVLNQADVSQFPVAGVYNITGAEADTITNYSDLYLRYKATQV